MLLEQHWWTLVRSFITGISSLLNWKHLLFRLKKRFSFAFRLEHELPAKILLVPSSAGRHPLSLDPTKTEPSQVARFWKKSRRDDFIDDSADDHVDDFIDGRWNIGDYNNDANAATRWTSGVDGSGALQFSCSGWFYLPSLLSRKSVTDRMKVSF